MSNGENYRNYYCITRYHETGEVCVYNIQGSQVHYGAEANAQKHLEYVIKTSGHDDYKVTWILDSFQSRMEVL